MSQKVGAIITGVLCIGLAFFIGVSVGSSRNPQYAPPSTLTGVDPEGIIEDADKVDFSAFWEAWQILDQEFVPTRGQDEVTTEDKVWGAIEGLASAYDDPYTVFFPPEENKLFETSISGSFSGVGIEVGVRDGLITVISPLKGTPAERAGVESGDVIVQVDDKIVQGMNIDEIVAIIRGEKGVPVELTLVREGRPEPFTVRIVRDTITIPTVDTQLRDDGIFVLSLYNFSAPSSNLFRRAIREFTATGSNKLILDLRGNAGGFLQSAIDVASWFVPKGETIVIEDHGGEELIHESRGFGPIRDDLEVVVLVDGGSASAAEIVAGALKEHEVATLIGTATFGKGSVQELIPLTRDTSLKVTVARWLTPEGNSISDGGLEPNITVEIEGDELENNEDPQLERAVELLKTSGN